MTENTQQPQENKLVMKWGNELFDDGISNAPQCLMRYSRRFIKATQFQLLCCIISYQYGADSPYPSQETIANNMGISDRRVRDLLSEMEEDGHVDVSYRYIDGKRSSSEYNFKPLIDKCLKYSQELQRKKNEGVTVVKKKKKKKPTPKKTLEEQSVPVVAEDILPVVTEQSVPVGSEDILPVGSEQRVPTNQELEERILNKNFKQETNQPKTKNQIKVDEIWESDLPIHPIKKTLETMVGRLVSENISIVEIENHFNTVKDTFTDREYNKTLYDVLKTARSPIRNISALMDDWLNRNRNKKNEFAERKTNAPSKPVKVGVVPDWMGKDDFIRDNDLNNRSIDELRALQNQHPENESKWIQEIIDRKRREQLTEEMNIKEFSIEQLNELKSQYESSTLTDKEERIDIIESSIQQKELLMKFRELRGEDDQLEAERNRVNNEPIPFI